MYARLNMQTGRYVAIDFFMSVINLQKATRKTDKVRKEELDVFSLTDEDLKAQLLQYGINPGPIVGEFSLSTTCSKVACALSKCKLHF